ncbi:hypothetical protein L249_7126 [Ophiocordyceps polyrhachis-furcata BCC 54312]|uniref:Nitrate reductase n=1 Tax=Ophiocordyceps polyrhachis-furcata BCC 54312 TaxID=1330021 RepID=A0A367LA51_9HYPO|nr:hypothetical protein L249_7126 [Ophiocordyceps polyrhachis-furcata BCC 54312]
MFNSSCSSSDIVQPSETNSSGDEGTRSPLSSIHNQDTTIYPLPPAIRPKAVLTDDLKTPDSHVPRDSRLIRLTGLHPLNVEAPLSELYDEGFLTSENLHYVRNHGGVPRCDDDHVDDWTFSIQGLVARPTTLRLRDLVSYDQVTYPITLVCAGNRRKEQNVVRKSKGFSWGPAGLSTALWTGTAIGKLLAQAEPQYKQGAKYVCFEGADELPNGYYGTSVKLSWCMDEQKGILVAHKMNGLPLHPDHGKPVRVVIPGQIGGRSVKWLKRIIVTAEPSENWYHIYDNRVLPTMITPEASADPSNVPVWRDERYAIYDLNSNSVICYPAHDEEVDVSSRETYKVRGYAYGGGGRRITRVEVTLDQGKTWKLADINYPEDLYRQARPDETLFGGKLDVWWRDTSFCWCFWDIDIPMAELEAADDIMVRAMDEGLMVQPRDMYWSVLGMMNNNWFRVVVHKEPNTLTFEHPTQPALMPGGWMERVRKSGRHLLNLPGVVAEQEPEGEIAMTNNSIDRLITAEELMRHRGETSPWFVVKGHVYDATGFLNDHPGGAASITGVAAKDATEEFMAIHSETAKKTMVDHHVGKLDEAALAATLNEKGAAVTEAARPVFLASDQWTSAALHDKMDVSSDARMFRFRLQDEKQQIGLPVGQHVLMRLRTKDAIIIRAYTPISHGTDRGFMDVLVKIYRPCPERPNGGKMTQALDSIPLGDLIDFKGPVGKFQYLGRGLCSMGQVEFHVRRFYMICAGSGITPIFQVLQAMAKDDEDSTECIVLYGNRTEEDILCRPQLDSIFGSARGARLQLRHTLTRPSGAWTGRRGRIDEAMVKADVGVCDGTGRDRVLVCGPKGLEEKVCDVLRRMGWTDGDIFCF